MKITCGLIYFMISLCFIESLKYPSWVNVLCLELGTLNKKLNHLITLLQHDPVDDYVNICNQKFEYELNENLKVDCVNGCTYKMLVEVFFRICIIISQTKKVESCSFINLFTGR